MEESIIYFYGKPTQRVKQEDVYLGNFYHSPILINGVTYSTVEHFYQSQKFDDPEIQERIRNAQTPKIASRLAHELTNDSREWSHLKESVMRTGIFAKFTQHQDLKEKLLATGTAKLVEDSHKDLYWGGSLEGSQNRMGILLMDLRNQLKNMP
ncbi:unnamed protein product [Blepharisma stoltei]|uniref:NADAR domain-containing protein n=1 Tax=Blepharisma stoltei TaxID=1481888 RepID=A0AAU9K993_9CILI|nr:unnamed protein product [Blepharisma stoltei]